VGRGATPGPAPPLTSTLPYIEANQEAPP